MNKTHIIIRSADTVLPEAYLRLVLKDANCGGYAIQDKDKANNPILVSDRMPEKPEFEAVQDLLKNYASNRVLLAFSKLAKVEMPFIQPFDFNMPGDEIPLLSFAADCKFPSLAEAGTTRHFVDKTILPMFGKFLKFSDGNLEKFMAEINDDTFIDSLMARVTPDQSMFCFLPPIGDPVVIGKNGTASTFPWGWTSDALGYTEAVSSVPKVEPTKKVGWWGGGAKATLAEEKSVETKPVEAPVPVVPVNAPAAPEPDTKIVAPPADPSKLPELPKEDFSDVPPPAGEWKTIPFSMNKKDRKSLIRRVTNCGPDLPAGWDKPDFKYWEVAYVKAPRNLPELAEQMKKEGPKDMRSSAGPKPLTVIGEVTAMVLSAEEKSEAESTILKIMDRQGKAIPSPLEILKAEQPYPKFSTQFGLKSDSIDSWLPVDVEAFAKANGKAFFHSWIEQRREKLLLREQLQAVTSKTSGKTEDVEVSVTGKPVATGEPAITEPLKKASGWGW